MESDSAPRKTSIPASLGLRGRARRRGPGLERVFRESQEDQRSTRTGRQEAARWSLTRTLGREGDLGSQRVRGQSLGSHRRGGAGHMVVGLRSLGPSGVIRPWFVTLESHGSGCSSPVPPGSVWSSFDINALP